MRDAHGTLGVLARMAHLRGLADTASHPAGGAPLGMGGTPHPTAAVSALSQDPAPRADNQGVRIPMAEARGFSKGNW